MLHTMIASITQLLTRKAIEAIEEGALEGFSRFQVVSEAKL